MVNTRSTPPAAQWPVIMRPRYPWFVWPSMAMMTVLGLIPLWAASHSLTLGPDGLGEMLETHLLMIAMGLFLLAFPALLLVSTLQGRPTLEIDEGTVYHRSITGRVQVIRLSDHAEVSLGEAVLAKGYQPRLEAVPMRPGDPLRTLPLRPFVHTRPEAEALVALIRQAAGPRPKPTPAQAAVQHRQTRREWRLLWAIILGAAVLLVLLKWYE
jgi:hypothetical protein